MSPTPDQPGQGGRTDGARTKGGQAVPKMMLIGATGCGKTTLYQRLFALPLDYAKTQALAFNGQIVDTPGEYLENRNYYSALMVTSMEVDWVALVLAATETQTVFPPGFARMFTQPAIGIITKTDLLGTDGCPADDSFAQNLLALAGVERIFYTSAYQGSGVDELKALLGI